MKNVFRDWNCVSRGLARASRWLTLFDLDGTLAAITSTPEKTVLTPTVRGDLQRLAARSGCQVGVISGRSIEAIQRLVRLRGLIYVGNHGLEIKTHGQGFIHPKAKTLIPALRRLKKQLNIDVRHYTGAFIEDKTLTLTVHYRLVPGRQVPALIQRVRRQCEHFPEPGLFALRRGKKIIEIRPSLNWNKGSAVIWLKRFVPADVLTLYAGDDLTDEDVFKVLGPRDISIRVGSRRPSKARYSLRRQRDVALLLKRLIALPKEGLHG